MMTAARPMKSFCLVVLVLTLGLATSVGFSQPVQWSVESGERAQRVDDGRSVLEGAGVIVLEGVPDGAAGLQFDAKIGTGAVNLMLRGKALGEGIRLNLFATGGWQGFQHNLRPGGPLVNTSALPIDLNTPTWWTVKVQMFEHRLMAKGWLSGQDEPAQWGLDLALPVGDGGPIGIETNLPLRDVKRVAIEQPRYAAQTEDHRQLRFGEPFETWVIETAVQETPEQVRISGELTELTFNRRTCSIEVAQMRDVRLPVVSLPDLKVIDAEGKEYRQRYAVDGDLRLRPSADERWVVMEGIVTPRTDGGEDGPCAFRYTYRLHRQSGLLHVRCVPMIPRGQSISVRQLVFVNELADTPEQQFDDYRHACWIPRSDAFTKSVDSREDDIVVSRRSELGIWGSAKCAFELTPTTFQYSSIDSAIEKDRKAYRHLVGGTRNGHRYLDMVFVNHKAGKEIAIGSGEVEYSYTCSFLPWRRYRPRVQLISSTDLPGANVWSVDREHEILKFNAEMGVTMTWLGYPPQGLAAAEAEQARLAQQSAEVHHYGMHDLVGWVEGGQWGGRLAMEQGWLSMDEARRAARWGMMNDPSVEKDERGEYPGLLCMNSAEWRRVHIDNITMPVMEKFNSSLVYWDWNYAQFYCTNPLHGDEGASYTPLGHLEMMDRFRAASAKLPNRPMAMSSTYDMHTNSLSRADYHNPGERFAGYFLPNRAEHNLTFSSMLYGTQCIYHTSGGVGHDTPRVYELALARCATVFITDHELPVPDWCEDKTTPMGFNAAEREMWMRYMTPLTIFGVNEAEYRHPFDVDYAEYCQSTAGVATVLYLRDGRALIVMAKEDESITSADATIDLKRVGIDGDQLLVFDAINKSAEARQAAQGKLELKAVDVSVGPRIFVVQALPTEPTAVWCNPATWSASFAGEGGEWQLELTGVPTGDLVAYVYCADAGTPGVGEGASVAFDEETKLAVIRTRADEQCQARVRVTFE
jgi:hypothetical protein